MKVGLIPLSENPAKNAALLTRFPEIPFAWFAQFG
jgi:hypothetical protein